MTEQGPGDQPAQPPGEGKRAAQGRATRGQLIEVATRLFAEHGYEGTSIEAVLAAAGVSRGALYHHFPGGKEALFEAVVMAVTESVTARLTEMIGATTDPVAALRAAAVGWISLALDPVVQRIVLVDAPAVLGWDRWRAVDDGSTLGHMRSMLQGASDAGRLPAHLVQPFAHMILSALDEYALVISRAPDPAAAVEEGRVAVEELLDRLLRP